VQASLSILIFKQSVKRAGTITKANGISKKLNKSAILLQDASFVASSLY
jgi:hypothetical protein